MHFQNNTGERYQIPINRWKYILKIAEQNGWKPKGTELNIEYLKQRAKDPDGGYNKEAMKEIINSWNGSYLTQEHQKVTYADALNIAFALEEALKERKAGGKYINEFISFCKKGSFLIM